MSENHTVLIADDEPITLKMLEMSVKKTGCQCVLFGDGNSVVEQMDAMSPDLAILDYQLPGRSGLELIEAFKANPRMANMPIIVVTGYRELALKESLLAAGAVDVILKPFSPQLLAQRVVELLG
jgi:CheY-like chemotaxis protein